MQRQILALLFSLTLCVPAATAQERLVFTPSAWDFGTIRESDGKVGHTFVGENRSDRPVVILDVVTTCGCTAPAFSRKPILPGEKTEIRVTYDPANRPGSFSRNLTVYSSEKRKVATLTIRGTVLPREKRIEELYPVDAGSGLRLTSTTAPFSYIYIGRDAQTAIGYANTSSRTLTVALQNDDPSGLLRASLPRQIAPGERGEINLRYSVSEMQPRYGTVRDALTLHIDGRPTRVQLLAHGIAVDDPGKRDNSGPRADIPKNIVKFGPVKRRGAPQSRSLPLANEGDAPLVVRAVELPAGIACSLRPGERIAPGDAAEMVLTIDPSRQEYGILSAHVILITNDPLRPMRRVRVTAVIEE